MQTPNLAEHASAGHMVRQTGERLRTNHVRASRFDEFQNLGGQQPAFAGLYAHGSDLTGLLDQFRHRQVLGELAVCQTDCLAHRIQIQVQALTHQGIAKLAATHAEIVLVPVGNVRTGGHELHDSRHHGLAIL